MKDDDVAIGSAAWVQRSSGRLTAAERRRLMLPLARTHLTNAAGRFRLAVGLHPGRHAHLPPARLAPPTTVLTRAAEQRAREILPVVLLNHSYRTYVFGRALGELVGVAGEVAEQVGLSSAATETVQTAITMHYTPGVTRDAGPVAYLLASGAGLDVAGLRSWELPSATMTEAVREHPRADFKAAFTDAFRQEAARVPEGRAQLLHRWGAFAAAIRFAPFTE